MNTNLCPACGQPNSCAQATSDNEVTQCWCFEVEVQPQALQELPPEALNRACLYPRCAGAVHSSVSQEHDREPD